MGDKTVFDPPSEVIAIGYVWSDGNASGGRRELFVSLDEAKRRLNHLVDEGKIKERKVAVFQLIYGKWEPLEIQWPEPLRLV